MYYSIRFGTDGIGLDADFGVFADDVGEARKEAAEMLRRRGYGLQADRGLFTVHGHPAWETDEPKPEPRTETIVTIDADAYARRIRASLNNDPYLPSAEAERP